MKPGQFVKVTTRITVNEMELFKRRTARYTKLDKKRITEILRELKINSAL
jgi:hypothetical protein